MRSGELAANQSSQGHHQTRMEFDVEKMEGSVSGMISEKVERVLSQCHWVIPLHTYIESKITFASGRR